MKLIRCFVSLFAFYIFLAGCHLKQKPQKPVEDSVKIDTVYTPPLIHVSEENRVYDSVSTKKFSFNSLSRQFDVHLNITRFVEGDDIHDSCIVKATLIDKKSRKVFDRLLVTSLFFYSNFYDLPGHIVSYSTGTNIFKEPVDNYVGDVVVADLNFDGKDDVVLINDMGGNGGPLYSYFVQQTGHKFVLDRYLTDSMSYFPDIDRERKTLTTYVHAGACCVGKQVYKLNPSSQQWKEIEHILLGLPKQHSKS